MRASVPRILLVGLLFLVLSGCAAGTASRDVQSLPNADNPEYLSHPFRLVALPLHVAGNILQYGVIEPIYFALSTVPDVVGLSIEEQRYLAQRKEAWQAASPALQ